MLAATIFVIRVLADNLLYYTDRDITTGGGDDAYRSRIILIICDLTSYAFCYAIVLRLLDTTGGRAISVEALVWTLAYFFIVEALHWCWCDVALRMVARRNDKNEEQRLNLLRRWRKLSREGAVGWLVVTVLGVGATFVVDDASRSLGAFVLGLTLISAWRYLSTMKDQYLGRRMSDLE
jgi:hypothetical protein